MNRIKKPSKKFFHDYRLPVRSTIGLLVILLLLILVRTYERTVLASDLGNKSGNKSNYARLLLKDSDPNLTKNDIGSDTKQTATPSSSTSLSISSNGSTSTSSGAGGTGSTGGGGGTGSTGGGGGGNVTPPAEPFSAQITGFGLDPTKTPFISNCGTTGTSGAPMSIPCKEYNFYATESTFNGPGTVNHKITWQLGTIIGEITGSYQAASGDILNKRFDFTVKLRCDQPGPYLFKFIITVPAYKERSISIPHNC